MRTVIECQKTHKYVSVVDISGGSSRLTCMENRKHFEACLSWGRHAPTPYIQGPHCKD